MFLGYESIEQIKAKFQLEKELEARRNLELKASLKQSQVTNTLQSQVRPTHIKQYKPPVMPITNSPPILNNLKSSYAANPYIQPQIQHEPKKVVKRSQQSPQSKERFSLIGKNNQPY